MNPLAYPYETRETEIKELPSDFLIETHEELTEAIALMKLNGHSAKYLTWWKERLQYENLFKR